MDLSDRLELQELGRLARTIQDVLKSNQWLLIGAMARDIQLHYKHSIKISRATMDVDIAIAVADWEHYAESRNKLLATEQFSASRGSQHRLIYNQTLPLDLLPFGGVETTGSNIRWPSNDAVVMSVIGFNEALGAADCFQLPGNVVTKVICLPAYILLKAIAWSERHQLRPKVDAVDLLMVLANYIECGNQHRLHDDDSDLLYEQNFDYELSGAIMAGRDLKELLADQGGDPHPGILKLQEIIQPQLQSAQPGKLLRDVPANHMQQFANLLQAFLRGLND